VHDLTTTQHRSEIGLGRFRQPIARHGSPRRR
jgi:hypothetical protein